MKDARVNFHKVLLLPNLHHLFTKHSILADQKFQFTHSKKWAAFEKFNEFHTELMHLKT